jgi:hypothetical protein
MATSFLVSVVQGGKRRSRPCRRSAGEVCADGRILAAIFSGRCAPRGRIGRERTNQEEALEVAERFKELGFQEGDTPVVPPKKARVFLQAQPA